MRQRAGAIAVRFGEIFPARDGAIEARHRILRPFDARERHPQEIVRIGVARRQRDRTADRLDALGELTALAARHRKVTQHGDVFGIGAQQCVIARDRAVHVAGAMLRDGFLQSIGGHHGGLVQCGIGALQCLQFQGRVRHIRLAGEVAEWLKAAVC